MEISRYASRLSLTSAVLPSGRPSTPANLEASESSRAAEPSSDLQSNQFPRDLPQEPDDARITGGTRSLSRRLLALNIPAFNAVRRKVRPASLEPSPEMPRHRSEVGKPLTAA